MTTRFDEKERRKIEDAKTLLAVIFIFILGILSVSIMMALSDWHTHLWFWGIK